MNDGEDWSEMTTKGENGISKWHFQAEGIHASGKGTKSSTYLARITQI